MRTKVEGSPTDWERVAREVVTRRSALDLTQEQLAEASEVSATTIRYLETAAKPAYRALTLARVATALGWKASRFTELLTGTGEPEGSGDEEDEYDEDRLAALELAVVALTAKVDAIYDRLVRPV
jgi:transcriptional regulator with XRE-family HTH domain